MSFSSRFQHPKLGVSPLCGLLHFSPEVRSWNRNHDTDQIFCQNYYEIKANLPSYSFRSCFEIKLEIIFSCEIYGELKKANPYVFGGITRYPTQFKHHIKNEGYCVFPPKTLWLITTLNLISRKFALFLTGFVFNRSSRP